jgi:hypothetical protein
VIHLASEFSSPALHQSSAMKKRTRSTKRRKRSTASPGAPQIISAPAYIDDDEVFAVEFAPGANGRPAHHKEMLSRIAILERLVAELREKSPGIGHNRPPESIEGLPFGEVELREIAEAIAVLKAQPVMPKAPEEAEVAASTLNKIGDRLWTYLIKQADVFTSKLVESAANELGKRLVQSPFWWVVASTLMAVAHSVNGWLH